MRRGRRGWLVGRGAWGGSGGDRGWGKVGEGREEGGREPTWGGVECHAGVGGFRSGEGESIVIGFICGVLVALQAGRGLEVR